ncbi:hypothetical protein [Anoxybacillus sp. J5B_2022]|uniref:hypothetical protein n=1 Tax=Anoxybacillus sp. J5B_2022 TaxID=3003246 RepID=UPI002286C275|nr:hypothetical protein [Anoxybacillus sp. J5B_2022]MCZ0757131.1 hypothetical protein [Anoxybacillus sp. J5B_2022]
MRTVDQTKRYNHRNGVSIPISQYLITELISNSIFGFELTLDGVLLTYSLVTPRVVER